MIMDQEETAPDLETWVRERDRQRDSRASSLLQEERMEDEYHIKRFQDDQDMESFFSSQRPVPPSHFTEGSDSCKHTPEFEDPVLGRPLPEGSQKVSDINQKVHTYFVMHKSCQVLPDAIASWLNGMGGPYPSSDLDLEISPSSPPFSTSYVPTSQPKPNEPEFQVPSPTSQDMPPLVDVEKWMDPASDLPSTRYRPTPDYDKLKARAKMQRKKLMRKWHKATQSKHYTKGRLDRRIRILESIIDVGLRLVDLYAEQQFRQKEGY